MLISPAIGLSSPAMDRRVVVLPQPEGPRSVNSLPSGTSKDTFCTAFTAPTPSSPAYSVNSDLTLSTAALDAKVSSCFGDADAPPERLRQHYQKEQCDYQHDTEGGKLDILPILPQLPDHDRYHLT